MDNIEINNFLLKYKCLEECTERICSSCKRSGFESTPAFYYYNDTKSVYLCDGCHHKLFLPKQLDAEIISNEIIEVVRSNGLY